jgi:poly(3-hydroxybutyrate) depolymerase
MGGMMAFELAHTLAHRFAAVAPTVAKLNALFEP